MNHDQALAALTTASRWRKSSYSQGENTCVEVTTELIAAGWRKSSYSQGENACVEVSTDQPGWVGVRDSKLGTRSPVLAITLSQWQALLGAAHTGELDT